MIQTATGYQNLVVWQKADELAQVVYEATKNMPKEEMFGLTSQLRRAALSVPLNIIEGYARRSHKTFANFLAISYGSLMETKYLVEFAGKLRYISEHEKNQLMEKINEVGGLIWQFRQRALRS